MNKKSKTTPLKTSAVNEPHSLLEFFVTKFDVNGLIPYRRFNDLSTNHRTNIHLGMESFANIANEFL